MSSTITKFAPVLLGIAGISLYLSKSHSADGTRSLMTSMDDGSGQSVRVKKGICKKNPTTGSESCSTFESSSVSNAARLLGNIRKKLSKFVSHLEKKYPYRNDVRLLVRRWDPSSVMEGAHNSGLTTYTLRKGEQISFCLRDRDGSNRLHTDENTLMYVGLHELTHLMERYQNPNHEGGFMSLWKFVLQEAEKFGIWTRQDYERNPVRYCGIYIDKNIL